MFQEMSSDGGKRAVICPIEQGQTEFVGVGGCGNATRRVFFVISVSVSMIGPLNVNQSVVLITVGRGLEALGCSERCHVHYREPSLGLIQKARRVKNEII